jgi:hypothetical protein
VFFTAGCDDKDSPDNPSDSVPDPEGTIIVSVRSSGNGGTDVMPDNCYYSFYIAKDDNFSGGYWKFVTIGAMNGLGNVTKIPATGWDPNVAVIPGWGYVAASYMGNSYSALTSKVTFVRIYVLDYIENTSGGVIGADVKYQSPFPAKPDAKEITLSETVINVPQGGVEYSTPITVSPFNANWSVTSSDNWCDVWTNDINSFRFYYRNNDTNTSRTATLTVKVEGLPEKTVTIIQAGKD